MFVFKNNNGSLLIRDKRFPNSLVVSFKNKMVRLSSISKCEFWDKKTDSKKYDNDDIIIVELGK